MIQHVKANLYKEQDAQLTKIKRQLRQKSGYPFNPQKLKLVLQALIEGRFDGIKSPDDFFCAVFRRSEQITMCKRVIINSHLLRIDAFQQKVWVDDQLVELTPTELQLLNYFLQQHDQILTCDELTEAIWNLAHTDTQTLKVHLCRMRRKLSRYLPDCPRLIGSIHGVGYRFNLSGQDRPIAVSVK